MQANAVEQVAMWLCENRCPTTLVELYHEWKTVHNEVHTRFLELAAACTSFDNVPGTAEDNTGAALEGAVADMLVVYGKQRGEAALWRTVKKARKQLLSLDAAPVGDDEGDSDLRLSPLTPMPTTVGEEKQTLLTETLRHGIGVISSSTSHGDGGGGMGVPFQLQLQHLEEKLEQTIAVLSKGLPTLVSAVDPMRKDVLIPIIGLTATLHGTKANKAAARLQLLTLYTRPNREHRAAVAEAWAMTLRNVPSSVLEYDIVPELYNLANARSTEKHILALDCVMCLAPLLGVGYHALRKSICQGLLRPLSEDEARTVRWHVVRCIAELWPICASDMGEKNTSHDTTTDSLLCYAELILRLGLHDSSGTVRRFALQSLRNDLLLPACTPCPVVLTCILPLFLSFLERESAVMDCDERPIRKGSNATASKNVDVVEEAVARNTLILAGLIKDAIGNALKGTAGGNGGVETFVLDAYLHVVLPSAYAMVLVSQEQGTLQASICAVASALALVVTELRMGQWVQVRNSLEMFTAQGCVRDRSDSDVRRSVGWRERQLCFLFAFLTSVSGGKETAGKTPKADFSCIVNDATTWLHELLFLEVMEDGREEAHEPIWRKKGETGEVIHAEEAKGDGAKRSEASARLDACANCLLWFATHVDEEGGNAAVVSSVLWSFANSNEERQRLLAIALVERMSGLPKDDRARETHIWPPLLFLISDTVYAVKEAAVKAALSMVKCLSTPAAHEKVMTAVFTTVEKEGCASRLGVAFLRHWCSLMHVMPAEPRESFLYPQLVTMIGQLTDTIRRIEGKATTVTALGRRGSQPPPTEEQKLIEDALESVLAVLAAIPRCAVVTPQLVNKYLIPSIRLLVSLKSLPASSRSQLLSITKEYTLLLESSKGLHGSPSVFDRIRSGWRKQF
ncbi:hypothetical protein MOQ_007177 [Trypanosoma cruzi marinkellei]|uniref:Uncharacterized protein n=1 Tax=Trypanosoma cruzi marinkellei TaxID=85056 RepID=K2MTQ0_TRYCR|nr:hypothetical protein MOQ_007177 [Trypanosoma cruzi marinkellei]